MESFSVWHWLIVLVVFLVFQWPFWRIVRKAGYPGALSLLLLVPFVNIIVIWVFAFVTWPTEKTR
jgi:hypothetical protein